MLKHDVLRREFSDNGSPLTQAVQSESEVSGAGNGIIELDEVMSGDVFSTGSKFVLHQTESINHVQQRSTTTYKDLLQKIDDMTELAPKLSRRISNIVLIYNGDFNLEESYKMILESRRSMPSSALL